MLFQLENVELEEGYKNMYMCRRFDMLTEKEKEDIAEKHKDDPDPEQATEDEINEYNEQKYTAGGEYGVGVPSYNDEILEEEVPEEFLEEYKRVKDSIEEHDKFKVNGMKTGKFFKSQKSPFGCAYSEDTRPSSCYLYKVTAFEFLENQENIQGHESAKAMRIYSSSVQIEEVYGDSENSSEDETLTYPAFIMDYIRELVPTKDENDNPLDPIEIVNNDAVDWKKVCRTEDFDEDFMHEYDICIDWDMICTYQVLSEEFIEEYEDRVNWKLISQYQDLSEDFILKHKDKVNLPKAVNNQANLSPNTVEKLINDGVTNWESIIDEVALSLETIHKYKDIIDWKLVCENCVLTEEFIDEHLEYVKNYWDLITKHQSRLSEEFLKAHEDDINWQIASGTQELSKDLIDDHYTELDWTQVCKNQAIDEEIIDKYPSRMNWHNLLTNIKFTETQLDKYFEHLAGEWRTVANFQNISSEWLEKHINDISEEDWNMLASVAHLDEDFIRRHKSRMDWSTISGPAYILTEAFMDEFKDYLDWPIACNYQKMSNSFIMDHFQYIDWNTISGNKEILSEEFIDRHKKKLNWDRVEWSFQMSESFILEHLDYVTWYNLFRFQKLSTAFKEKYKWKLSDDEIKELGL